MVVIKNASNDVSSGCGLWVSERRRRRQERQGREHLRVASAVAGSGISRRSWVAARARAQRQGAGGARTAPRGHGGGRDPWAAAGPPGASASDTNRRTEKRVRREARLRVVKKPALSVEHTWVTRERHATPTVRRRPEWPYERWTADFGARTAVWDKENVTYQKMGQLSKKTSRTTLSI